MVVDHEIIASQMSLAERIHMATLCHDTDMIPKVPGAGSIQVEPNGMRVQLMHNGLRVIADGYCGSWMTELIRLCRGHHEPQEERVFYEIVARLENDATMIELGAYWAFYSLWFLQGQPRRVAILLEPDPLHRAAGETNAKLNNISLQILSGFIGSSPAVAVPFHTDSGEDLLIPRVTVPQLMEENGIAKLDILHCDTQGAELDVLESCADMLRSGRILSDNNFYASFSYKRRSLDPSALSQSSTILWRVHYCRT